MPDLDDLLNPSSGREVAAGAGDAARPGDVDAVLRRGARRGRRTRAAAVGGVALATALAVGVGVGVSGGLSADAPPPPVDRPSAPATPDAGPDRLAPGPDVPVTSAAVGEDLDDRAVVRTDGTRSVLGVTDDGGESWTYLDRVGAFPVVRPAPGGAGAFLVDEVSRPTQLVTASGERRALGEPGPTAPLADDEGLAYVGRGQGRSQVAVAGDGSTHRWPGDPLAERRRTGVTDGWLGAELLPTGVVVQQVAGDRVEVAGRCCRTSPDVRWSVDGGETWTTAELTTPSAVHGFTVVVPSLDPGVVAVHPAGEGPVDRVLSSVRLNSSGGLGASFSGLAGSSRSWSAVLPDGRLAVWTDGSLVVSSGIDWDDLRVVDDAAPPDGVDADDAVLADVRVVDGEARLVAVTEDGDVMVTDGDGATWSPAEDG